MVNEDRLQEVLKLAADAIEGLYKELKRNPPAEGVALVKDLRKFAADLSN